MKTNWLKISLLFFALPFAFTLSTAQVQANEPEEVFRIVEEMPHFPIGNTEGMSQSQINQTALREMLLFIFNEMNYPEEARQQGIEGTVVVQFIVNKDGSYSDLKVNRSLGGGCDEEALRIIEAMFEMNGPWEPGKQSGQKKRVQFNLPIRFRM
ncbi:MAG: energy transducer TonB [Saprospiraceae bacterium]|nr:energy transducer TonB [Saprospiraceae bacterium]